MSRPFENALVRECTRQLRQREGGQNTELSDRMDTPTLSPAGVGSATSPPPLDTRLSNLVADLTAPGDPTRLSQEIEDFIISFPINVDDALNLLSVPPVAGVGTEVAPTTTTVPPVRPPRPRPAITATRTRPAGRRIGVGTSTTTTAPTPRSRLNVAAKQPSRHRRHPPASPPSSQSPPRPMPLLGAVPVLWPCMPWLERVRRYVMWMPRLCIPGSTRTVPTPSLIRRSTPTLTINPFTPILVWRWWTSFPRPSVSSRVTLPQWPETHLSTLPQLCLGRTTQTHAGTHPLLSSLRR